MSQPQFQYTRLAHQALAVRAISEVFADVRFDEPVDVQANPTFSQARVHATLQANIVRVRAAHGVTTGPVQVATTLTPALNLDVLMETGTGKTFTFIETIHKLHQQHRLSKFIVLVPSNAIRQGTLKSLQTTAAFFAREYDNQKIHVVNYSDKTVRSFIQGANRGLWVMVSTYQSFAGDSRLINKRGVEANLFGQAKSYMEALAHIRPVLIIDEPHRFEGKVVQEYLTKFNPLLTIRFGATFKKDEYRNLIYTLDSVEAFRQRLVKGITVDTVGTGYDAAQVLCLHEVTGSAKERTARVGYQTLMGKAASVLLKAKDNLGAQTGLAFLDGHVVEAVTSKELLFTNGFALPLGEPTAYGMLAEEMQSQIIERAVASHFEREEDLFRRGIKSLTLFFIDAVGKYWLEGAAAKGKTAPEPVIRAAFERHYKAHLALTLAKPTLDAAYRAYLERTQADIGRVHKGYFARSHSEKGEEEAIKLILQEKEKLLSFDTDLRFIFSMWALQEGWDNPNVFTLCKLAPSNSKITKLQQIGRGLRLAVNQQLARVPADDAAFDDINDLTVVVPASEGDFVAAIQQEMGQRSVKRVARVFDDKVLAEAGVALSTRLANRVLDALAARGVVALDDLTGQATLLLSREDYQAQREDILATIRRIPGVEPHNAINMQAYLDAYYDGAGQVKRKQDKAKPTLTLHPLHYQQFRHLWESLNRDAVLHYELDTAVLTQNVLQRIAQGFEVQALSIQVTRTTDVHSLHGASSTQTSYTVAPHSVLSVQAFARELARQTKLSLHTISGILAQMPAAQFAQIRHNENRALTLLRDLVLRCVHELLVSQVRYDLREVRVKTALTDNTGTLLKTIPLALCGQEVHAIHNPAVQAKSLYADRVMPVDSQIERDTVDESLHNGITVFAKLPKINIPTPAGHYNPDFGYVIRQPGQPEALYLVVETKGYETEAEIPERERWKLQSARRFFDALRAQGVPVRYETKINHTQLAGLIQRLLANP